MPESNIAAPASAGGRFLRQIRSLAKPYWYSERRVKIRSAALLLLLLGDRQRCWATHSR